MVELLKGKSSYLNVLFGAVFIVLFFACCSQKNEEKFAPSVPFIHVDGVDLVDDSGNVFFIKGTNLGNWLNPEGYMFGFRKQKCNSPHLINEYFCQLVGPDEAADFWKAFKDNYIQEEDIRFIASTGANTIRAPFHYKLFTDEDYMGLTSEQDGFARLDTLVEWCRRSGLRVILDMHDCPGGQTGDNIDDSYGYPWLFSSPASQDLFCSIWRDIAAHYKDEPIVLGYELMNEPIAHYFKDDLDSLNMLLWPVYKRCIAEIRQVDQNHIILLGGAQWNGNFRVFTDSIPDTNYMWACHRYSHGSDEEGIKDFIAFRDSTGVAMCMTETGHNHYEWYAEEVATLTRNNISFLFWPYKKISESSWVGYNPPENWQAIIDGANADRRTYAAIRDSLPSYHIAHQALRDLIVNSRFENCVIDSMYIHSMGFSIGE